MCTRIHRSPLSALIHPISFTLAFLFIANPSLCHEKHETKPTSIQGGRMLLVPGENITWVMNESGAAEFYVKAVVSNNGSAGIPITVHNFTVSMPLHNWNEKVVSSLWTKIGLGSNIPLSNSVMKNLSKMKGVDLRRLSDSKLKVMGLEDPGLRSLVLVIVDQLEVLSHQVYMRPQSLKRHFGSRTGVRQEITDTMFPAEIVHVCIISNRIEGIVGSLGSIAMNTKKPGYITVWLITNEPSLLNTLKSHSLWKRYIHKMKINLLLFDDTLHQLKVKGINPVWTWKEYGRSIENSSWISEYTVSTAKWDSSAMHMNPLNHLRFYLHHLPQFEDLSRLIFVDDDIIVRGDIRVVWSQEIAPRNAITATCNLWTFDKNARMFQLRHSLHSLADSPVMVLAGREEGDAECPPPSKDMACVNSSMWSIVREAASTINGKVLDLTKEFEWNFGLTLFNLEAWRTENLTSTYEQWMRVNYKYRIFPEDSLTYGLGLPLLALSGNVECWELDTDIVVLDGLGFVNPMEIQFSHIPEEMILGAFALHFDGPNKPWFDLHNSLSAPYLWTLKGIEGKEWPSELPMEPIRKNRLRSFVMLTEPSTDAEWLINALDNHPKLCATGKHHYGRFAFPLMAGNPWEWTDTMKNEQRQITSGCVFGFMKSWVSAIDEDPQRYCSSNGLVHRWPKDMGHHASRLCNFYERISDDMGLRSVYYNYFDAVLQADNRFVPCLCPVETEVRIQYQLTDWVRYKPSEDQIDSYELYRDTGTGIILFSRKNRLRQLIVDHIKSNVTIKPKPTSNSNETVDVHIHRSKLVKFRKYIERFRYIRGQLRLQGIPVLELSFEQCFGDEQALCLQRLSKFLGLNVTRVPLPDLERNGVLLDRVRISNLEEVVAVLQHGA